jgi:hypothetical protein
VFALVAERGWISSPFFMGVKMIREFIAVVIVYIILSFLSGGQIGL